MTGDRDPLELTPEECLEGAEAAEALADAMKAAGAATFGDLMRMMAERKA